MTTKIILDIHRHVQQLNFLAEAGRQVCVTVKTQG